MAVWDQDWSTSVKTPGPLQDLFGGPGKGFFWGQEPKEYYHPAGAVQEWTPEQIALQQALIGYLEPTIGQPGAQYGGDMVAGMSPYEQSFMDRLTNYQVPTGESLREKYMAGPGGALTRAWKEDVIPELRGEFGKKGLFYGSGRQTAETESAGRLMEALNVGATEYELGARKTSLQEILGLTGAGMQFGGTERGVRQAGLTANYQEWLRTQPGATPEMAMIMQLLGLDPLEAYGPLQTVLGRQEGALEGGGEAVLSNL